VYGRISVAILNEN